MSQACGHLPSQGVSPGQVVDTKSGVELSCHKATATLSSIVDTNMLEICLVAWQLGSTADLNICEGAGRVIAPCPTGGKLGSTP